MARPRSIPSYRHHKQSGQAVVTVTDSVTGQHRDLLLGKWGTSESKAEYGRVIQQWEAASRRLPDAAAGDLTINELILAAMEHVQQHYRDSAGQPTHEAKFGFPLSLRPLRQLYGTERTADFGPLKLKAVRQQMVLDGVSRNTANQRTWRIKRLFKWAVENELIPPSVHQALQAVSGLQRGRTEARDTGPVRPVPFSTVDATIPYLPGPLAALVQLQLLTGARAGELVTMRACDLDTSDRVWVYRPPQHKTAHHGMSREIYLGPKAQTVLKPWLKLDLQAYLFSPKDAEEARHAERSGKRQTPRYPSHTKRNERKRRGPRRQRAPGERYTTLSYGRAIARACDLAFPPPEPLAKLPDETVAEWKQRLTPEQRAEMNAWQKAHRWRSHQLRHTAATLIRREHGIEMARIILGHSTAFTTEIYAEADRVQAIKVIEKVG